MKILVTRHGQTDWNVLEKLQGQTDIELNDIGIMQARETGQLLKNEDIDLIITSPLKRATETAEIINKNFNIPIIEDRRLMERKFGEFEGKTKNDRECLKEQIQNINDIWDYTKNIKISDMESIKDFCARVYEFLDEIIKKYEGKNILIVTHGGVSLPIKCFFMKRPLSDIIDTDIINGLKNCEIIKFDV